MNTYVLLFLNPAPVGQATESANNMGDAQKISLEVGEAKYARSCNRPEQTQTPHGVNNT